MTPQPQTITERKRLAQEIRNDLHEFKRYADASGSAGATSVLTRASNRLQSLLRYEGLRDDFASVREAQHAATALAVQVGELRAVIALQRLAFEIELEYERRRESRAYDDPYSPDPRFSADLDEGHVERVQRVARAGVEWALLGEDEFVEIVARRPVDEYERKYGVRGVGSALLGESKPVVS